MSEEIEISIMASSAEGLQPLLDRFEAQENIRVRVRLLAWDTAWSDLVKFGLYGDGPDVSEVGSTWLGDLVAMNALRPFADYEVAGLGADRDRVVDQLRLVVLGPAGVEHAHVVTHPLPELLGEVRSEG